MSDNIPSVNFVFPGSPGLTEGEEESIRLIRFAVDHGVSFMDNCWDYNNGASHVRMGKALRDGTGRSFF